MLRELLTGTDLATRTSGFAHSMRRFTTRPSGLMLFGPVDDEPWHLTAHIDDEVTRAGLPELRPSLVRWAPAAGAPPHLSIGLERLGDASRGDSLLVVSEEQPESSLLERVHDAKRRGATVFSIDNGDADLASVSHESLVPELLLPSIAQVDAQGIDLGGPLLGFEMTQHLVSLAVADDDITTSGWRARLRRFIERVGGDTGT